jgi:hypothetical protein
MTATTSCGRTPPTSMAAYNFAFRLKTLNSFTPYGYTAKI